MLGLIEINQYRRPLLAIAAISEVQYYYCQGMAMSSSRKSMMVTTAGLVAVIWLNTASIAQNTNEQTRSLLEAALILHDVHNY